MRLGAWISLALLAASCGDGRTPLLLYSPHGRVLLTVTEEAFEQQFPAIDVRWLDMGSQEVYDRIRSERANPQADVWFGGPSTILARAAVENLLEPFRPQWAEQVPEGSRHSEDLFIGLYRTPTFMVYNREAVADAQAPRDWDDLLDAQWRDRILIRDPLASGTMRTIFGAVLAESVRETGSEAEGFEWLRKLDDQTKEYVHSPALLHEKIVRQEGLVTLWEMTDILSLIDRGAPLGYRFPKSGAPVISDSIALVRGAPHPSAAQQFIDWVGSPDALRLAAEKAFRLPARSDLESLGLPEWVSQVESRLVEAEVDWELLERRGAEWMARWDREIRGQGS